MASGYTHIDDGLMWELCSADLTNQEFRVLLAIIKKTIGFNKKKDKISYSQLSAMTEINTKHIPATLKALEHKGWIKVSRKSANNVHLTNIISIKRGVSPNEGGGVTPQTGNGVSPNEGNTNKKTKATSTDLPFGKAILEENKIDISEVDFDD